MREPQTMEYVSELGGKRVIVTGGSEGIGRAIVEMLASHGALIVTCSRDEASIDDAARECAKAGGEVYGFRADVSKAEDVSRLFDEADGIMGGVDILVANAAVGGDGVTTTTDEQGQELVDINLTGYILCARHAAQRMDGRGGHILFIGSMSADVREAEGAIYAATKAGVQGLAGAFRKEVNEKGIHVTLIEPGSTATPMQDLAPEEATRQIENKEMMLPEDIADCVAFALTRPARCDVVSMQVRPHRQII